MKDRTVIAAFVAHLRAHGYAAIKIERWPDLENRVSPDIDAIASPFAIEHTSADTLPEQRKHSDWFMQAVGSLEDEFPALPYRLNITLQYDAIRRGQNWGEVRNALKLWIDSASPALSEGTHRISSVPGVPFEMVIRKASWRAPGLFFSRQVPEDGAFPARLKTLFDRKANKLAPYQTSGKTTVLLVESEDIALMNDSLMVAAIRIAYPAGLPQGVDRLWYADTSLPSDIEFINFTTEFRIASE